MKRFGEEELIAYHLGELPWWTKIRLRRELERDAALAGESEEIAATLRAFCGDAAPGCLDDMRVRSWQRVRGSLGVVDVPRKSRRWIWATASGAVAAAAMLAAWIAIPRAPMMRDPVESAKGGWDSSGNLGQKLMAELQMHRHAERYNHRPGPLTTGPEDAVADDPALAVHLDTAERVLTEVSHTEGPLEPRTREQVHRLLLENAVYRQSAEQHGDMEAAAVIDDLGRVLTTLDAEEQEIEAKHDDDARAAFRMQMNLGGVLLDLRILHRDDGDSQGR
ncbi:MAG TPA: hypothetical protein VGU23_02375 [Acidobacteriaceae bacterium]|nr:hypothetical protein [Acidobacteriaceae bacterium]